MAPAAPSESGLMLHSPDTAGSRARAFRSAALLLAVPLALAAAAYMRVLDAPFVLDDDHSILENPAVQSLGASAGQIVKRLFTVSRPVTDFTYALDHAVGGFAPWSYHATNLAIHLAVVVLVFMLTRQLARLAGMVHELAIAIGVAGVFALHPIQTAAVSYVSQRSEILASGLYVVVVLLLLAAERHGWTWRGCFAWAGALLAYTLALGSKTIAITAPAAYLLVAFAVERTPAPRLELTSWRRRAASIAPFFALAGVTCVAVLDAVRGESTVGFGIPKLGRLSYFLTELKVILLYLRLLVWPAGQNLDWDFPVFTSLLQPGVLASGMLLLGLTACGVALIAWGRTRSGDSAGMARLAGLGILWFFLVLSVTSSVVPIVDLVFEHRLYLASWGVFVAAAAGFGWLTARFALRPLPVRVFVACVWCALAGATWVRNSRWETPEALWRDAMAKSPEKARPYGGLGDTLLAQGRYPEALSVYADGLARTSGDPFYEAMFLAGMGRAQAGAGRLEEAAASLRAALAREPESPRRLDDLATVLINLGDLPGAERCILRSLELDAGNPQGWNRLAELRFAQRDFDASLQALRRAAALDPELGIVPFNVGRALLANGQIAEACRAWREALKKEVGPALRLTIVELLGERCRR